FGGPIGTLIVQFLGWRGTVILVAALGTGATLAVHTLVPVDAGQEWSTGPLRSVARAVLRPRVLLSLAVGVTGSGGLFACYSYVTPMMVRAGGFRAESVTILLVIMGLGMTSGSYFGGRFADRNALGTLMFGLIGVVASL